MGQKSPLLRQLSHHTLKFIRRILPFDGKFDHIIIVYGSRSPTAIAYLDAPRLLRALSAGIGHVFQRREYLNRINVFPVPDGDTGTNMAFTFKTILEATATSPDERVDDLMDHVADAALDGARGNSGAIMAQYFHGFREAVAGRRLLTAEKFAQAAAAGAEAAWTAMSKPVQGTLPTVLEDFSQELTRRVAGGVSDFQSLLAHGLERARVSLANTPNQLAVLKQAGVVDAGGQGFVDLLDGIWTFIVSGEVDPPVADLQADLTGARSRNSMLGSTDFAPSAWWTDRTLTGMP